MSVFENVVPALARALTARGFEDLTAVQTAVLTPEALGADLVVSAQTGSGKTVAFGLNLAPTLLSGEEKLAQAAAPLALIIAPTRELAMQVRGELEWLYASAGGRIASCVGGMDMRDERRLLNQGAHIVVGTPGRLVDHIRRGSLQLQDLRAVVLDEADEMLKLGFREELEIILEASPAERRTLMFSATMPRAIETLAKTYQRNALRLNTISGQKQHADIAYRALVTASHEAENAIFNVLRYYDATNALVFCGTRAAVTRLESRFANRGLSVVALSGELSQSARTHALQALRDHRAQVCVATDVAARGIDLPDLDLVIHADLPKNTEALLHRSGRTGRAGRKGASVLIVPHSARRRTERLLRDSGIQAQWSDPPSADEIKQRDDQRLLADPLLSAPPEAAEQNIVQAVLAQHDPAQIAAAFVRLYRKGQAAPEDLAAAPDWSDALKPDTRVRHAGPPENFEGGVWVSLSIGRALSAEPRWLIPMLCKNGGITKRQIGSIKIQQHETLVEIDAASIDGFFARIGKDGHIEKSIRVTRLDGAPSQRQEPRPEQRNEHRKERRPDRREEQRPDQRPEQRNEQRQEPRKDQRSEQRAERSDPRARKPAHNAHAARPKPKGEHRPASANQAAAPKHQKKKPQKKWHPAD